MMQSNTIIGNKFISLESTDSTNKYAERLIDENKAEEGTIIITKTQTDGKGYSQNSWYSDSNKNLTFSLILKPDFIPVEKQFIIHKITSLSVLETLKLYIEPDFVKIKWPNDIYYKKFKIAGILTENKIMGDKIKYSIIGIGININQDHFPKELPNPISLYQITNQNFILYELLKQFCNFLDIKYKSIKKDIDFFNEDYLNNLFQRGEYKKYFANNKEFEGKIVGIDEFGFLKLVDSNKETKCFDFKEIKYIFENHS